MAIFQDDPSLDRGLKGYLKDILGFEATCFNTPGQFKKLKDTGGIIDADVALIDLSFFVRGVTSEMIIEQFLPKDTRRVITSGHGFKAVKRDLIERLEADNFWREDLVKELPAVLNLGKATEEEIKLRGFSVAAEGGGRVGLEMGIAPDARMYDEASYKTRAKRGEREQ